MRALLLAALGGLLALGCSGTVAVSTRTPTTADPPARTWPAADPLEGAVPVGRWLCLPAAGFAEMGASNAAQFPAPCNVMRFEKSPAAEFRPDGTGWTLRVYERPAP